MSRRPARKEIEASLAERGRPVLWANEQETAVLSGFSVEAFRQQLPALEKLGFPRANPLNGKRPIPAILQFWRLPVNDPGLAPPESEPDESTLEKWQ